MWSVATWKDRERDGSMPWTIDEFREAGRSDCADIMRHWDHYGRISRGTCIEIGCGAGRLTSALLGHFDRIYAVDVSEDQVELAKQVIGNEVSRVAFAIVNNPVLDVSPLSCSAMISTHVFQHFSSYSGIAAYLAQTHRALMPGASICFQLPVPGADKGEIPSLSNRAFNFVRTGIGRALGRRRFMEYNRYPAGTVVATLRRIGFVDIEVRIFALATTGFRQSFFFARKEVASPLGFGRLESD